MSDIKLFRMGSAEVEALSGQSVQIEKSLQTLFEKNLEALLDTSEHSTGPVHGGRIDTLGLDEDTCPVIIEYKRGSTRMSSSKVDDVQVRELKNYIAFKRIKNFACVEVFPQTRVVNCLSKGGPSTVMLKEGFTRDVRKIGHLVLMT